MQRFWQSLESLPGCATVPAEWKRMLGDEYTHLSGLLRPSGELATRVPHPEGDPLPLRVVTHGPDDHVGICDGTGRRFPLSAADLMIQELDAVVLCRCLQSALGIKAAGETSLAIPGTSRIGHDVPLAGFRFPVFLAICHDRTTFVRSVAWVAASQKDPFWLLVPTGRFLDGQCEDVLNRVQACPLLLEEALTTDGEGRIQITEAGRDAIGRFRQAVLPAARPDDDPSFFPTPSGIDWPNIKIHLLDGHTVSVVAGDARGVFTYTQMGMSNRKNGMPTVQWELLRGFASERGLLTWQSRCADRRNQKRKELLARKLQTFFRLVTDPIVTVGSGWQTRFAITDGG